MAAGIWFPGKLISLLLDVISYNDAVNVCEQSFQWQLALGLLAMMRSVHVLPKCASATGST